MTTKVAKDERFCVRVRNLPAVLSGEAVTALLSHYGAVHVRLLHRRKTASSGREPSTVAASKTQKAIAAFSSREAQQNAQRRLQTLELAGHHLQVEVVGDVDASNAVESKAQHTEEDSRVPLDGQPPLPKGLPPPLPPFPPSQSSIPMQNFMYAPAPLAPHLGLHYAPSPLLEYKYPKATESIVRNVANALIALPRFYTQVLHLMNKMNLPPPFEEDAIPGRFSNTIKEEEQAVGRSRRRSLKRPRPYVVSSDQQIVEEDEESDENLVEEAINTEAEPVTNTHDTAKKLRLSGDTDGTRPAGTASGDQRSGIGPLLKPVIVRKTVARQHKRASVLKSSALATAFEESGRGQQQAQRLTRPGVISETEVNRQRLPRTELLKEPLMASYDRGAPSSTIVVQNLADTVDQNDLRSVFGYVLPLDVALDSLGITLLSTTSSALVTYPSETLAVAAVNELHGVLLEGKPLIVSFQSAAAPSSAQDVRRWSVQELANKRLSASQLATEKAMKKYERGKPSATLYVKNLAKSVELADLLAVFGAVLPSESGAEALKICHFTEGKMKCQAFVEFPTVDLASNALQETHGIVLKDKPLVVCFRKPPRDQN